MRQGKKFIVESEQLLLAIGDVGWYSLAKILGEASPLVHKCVHTLLSTDTASASTRRTSSLAGGRSVVGAGRLLRLALQTKSIEGCAINFVNLRWRTGHRWRRARYQCNMLGSSVCIE